ncbi:MAG: penicillin-binding protein 2, partial [Ilumatobacteraceae bacterium]
MRRHRSPMKNAGAEAGQFRRRAVLGFVMVLLTLIGLAGWYFKLQVLEHAEYATRSEANRIKPRPLLPGRGLIFDRRGRLLADNVPAYRLDVVPRDAGDSAVLLTKLRDVIALDPADVARFEDARRASRGFQPIPIKLRLTYEEVARFAVDRWRFPGVELVPYLTRRYPYRELFAHVVGYVSRIDEADLARIGASNAPLTHTGKTGIERYYEEALRGRIGYEKVETNVDGRALRSLGRVPAVPGADLRLSIDVELQRAMVEAFGENTGSAVAVDPRTGEILGMVSLPSYDPNWFVNGISHRNYKAL